MAVTDLRAAARDHLWLHFTRMHGYEPPVIVRGEGCYLWDDNGKRYLDALAGLFSVNIGYSYGEEIGQAALAQMRELPFYTNWSYAHPRAIELGAELARLAPSTHQPRVLRLGRLRSGRVGVEACAAVPHGERRAPVEGGRRAAPRTTARRWARSRSTGSPRSARRSSRSSRTSSTSATRTATTGPPTRPRRSSPRFCSTDLDERDRAGRAGDRCDGDLRAGAERRRLVHAARRLLPGRARDLRPLRDPALRRRGDHRLSAAPATGSGASKYDIKPDLITCAKGLSSSLRRDRRGARRRQGLRRVQHRDGDVLARDHLRRSPGRLRDRAQEPRDHGARGDRRAGAPSTRRPSARSSRRCSSSTSSATCAAPATSGRSSS